MKKKTESNTNGSRQGIVYLVGAGPGDPGLISVRGAQLLATAEVVVFDALANPALLDLAPAEALRIDAGKRAGLHKLTQDQTNALLAEHGLAGKRVVRLKGGDPYVFGRGSEEAMYLHERGVRVQVVPGITSAIAATGAMGVPVTHRNIATSCTFITGHEDPSKPDSQVDYQALAGLVKSGGTLCFYMAVGRLPAVVQTLMGFGCEADTPAAVAQWGTLPRQNSLRTTLSELPSAIEAAGIGAPSIVLVGRVAALNEEALNWFENRPLFGQSIVVTRTRQQASQLKIDLELRGAEVFEAPTIAIAPAADQAALDAAVHSLSAGDWLIFTSRNGVDSAAQALARVGGDARRLAGVKIAAVGQATAEALVGQLCIKADLVPDRAMGEAVGEQLIKEVSVSGRRFVLWQAEIARPVLGQMLSEAGGKVEVVEAYQTRPVEALPEALLEALSEGRVGWLTFTSGSTARNFFAMLPDASLAAGAKIASIGPMTSQAIVKAGRQVDVEATEHNIAGLVAAICASC